MQNTRFIVMALFLFFIGLFLISFELYTPEKKETCLSSLDCNDKSICINSKCEQLFILPEKHFDENKKYISGKTGIKKKYFKNF